MGPEGIILVNSPITTLQQSLTHSAMDQNWNLRSSSVSYMCVNALRSPSKPFLMIEWGTALEHTWWSADDHIWASSLSLLPFNNYHARLLEWIEGYC